MVRREVGMFDSKTIAEMRTVLDEVCRHLPASTTETKTFVATRILECATRGEITHDALAAGRGAVIDRFGALSAVREKV
jgi:hypothetical protein